MTGKLYGVGIGPGDPELITIKAKRILSEAEVIAFPKTALEKASLAWSIAADQGVGGKEQLELLFPMSSDQKVLRESWNAAAGRIREKLEEGKRVAFITLGDPTVYSTYMYIHQQLVATGYAAEIIPGVPSFCAAAAKAGISLAENRETVAILPSADQPNSLAGVLSSFDNIVLMKVSRDWAGLKAVLKAEGLLETAVLASRCGMEGERITTHLEAVDEADLSYFTTVIVKKAGVRGVKEP